jgi:hypothetical protein
MRRSGEYTQSWTAGHNRKKATCVIGGVLHVLNPGMIRQAFDQVDREIGLLKLRIGIDQKRQIDRVGNRQKIAFDLLVIQRKI